MAEREEISRGISVELSCRAIARILNRSASTSSREINRSKGRETYRAIDADDRSWRRARCPQRCALAKNPVLRGYVAARLREDWSPEQIAGRLKITYSSASRMQISYESIYKSLFMQSRGAFPKVLQEHLRSRKPIRKARSNTTRGQWRSQIKDTVPISKHPANADARVQVGHWEGDPVIGTHQSQIATVVECATRLTRVVDVDSWHAASVTARLIRELGQLPERRSVR